MATGNYRKEVENTVVVTRRIVQEYRRQREMTLFPVQWQVSGSASTPFNSMFSVCKNIIILHGFYQF